MLPKRFFDCTHPRFPLFLLIVLLLASVFISAAETSAQASDSDLSLMLEKARQYICDTQNADGSWGSRLAVRDTALCAEGLLWLGDDTDAMDNALAWLSANDAVNSDFISRKAWCMALAGDLATPSQGEIDFLAACVHEDGSLSLAPGEGGNPLDTAISYPALLSLDEMEKAEAAITYLTASQLEDGGFSSGREGNADLPTTALALKALSLRKQVGSLSDMGIDDALEAACSEAALKLAAYQNEDGGFGEQGSTPYETALALDALAWSPDGTADTDAALSWMYERQLEDGSIAGDLAATAILLAAARPNPYIEGIELSDSEPPEGSTLTITFHLGNTGMSATGPCSIEIFPVDDPGTPFASLDVDDIPGRGSIDVELNASTLGMQGPYEMLAELYGGIADYNFMDNSAALSFFVTPGYDFTVTEGDLSYLPADPDCATTTNLSALVHNTGDRDTQDVEVSFYDGDPEAGGAELGTATIPFLDREKMAAASVQAVLASGDHAIYALVDGAGLIPELNEGDNQANISLAVAQAATMPEPVSPDDGASLSQPSPTFTWLPSTGADVITYQLELDTSLDFSSPNLRTYTDIPQQEELVSFTLPEPLSEGTWYWRVHALGGMKLSEALETRKLTIDTTPPEITTISCEPTWISPNDDDIQDEAILNITLSEDSILTAAVLDDSGTSIRTLAQDLELAAGEHDLTWDGEGETGAISEGSFTIDVVAIDGAGNESQASTAVGVDVTAPVIYSASLSSDVFSPNGDGALDSVSLSFMAEDSGDTSPGLISFKANVLGESEYLGEAIMETEIEAGLQAFSWDGSLDGERIIQTESTFLLELILTDAAGNQALIVNVPISVDLSPPAMAFPKTFITGDTEPKVRITVEADAEAAWAYLDAQEAPMLEETAGLFIAEYDRPDQAGTYSIAVRAVDEAGNTAYLSGANLILPGELYGNVITHTTRDDFISAESMENIDTNSVWGDVAIDVHESEELPVLPRKVTRATAYYLNDLIYIFGGRVQLSYGGGSFIFDPVSRTYSNMPGMLQTYGDTTALGPDGKVYLFGGNVGSSVTSASEVYDPATNSWSVISPLPVAIGYCRCATGADGRIYIFGGFDIDSQRVDTVYAYDTVADTYELVSHLPSPRCCHVTVEHDGLIYVGGGHDNDGDLTDFWRFDPINLTWDRLADIPGSITANSALHAPPDSIYCFGLERIVRYQINSDTWELMPGRSKYCVGATLGPDNRVFLFGGYDIYGGAARPWNTALIYDVTYNPEAVLVSSPIDLGYRSSFGDIALSAELPGGTDALISTRTSEDGQVWSDWSDEIPAPGGKITSPHGRFLQYRLRLTTSDPYRTPRVFDVSISYNRGPHAPRTNAPCGDVLAQPRPAFSWTMLPDPDGDALNCTLEIDRSPSFETPELKRLEGIDAGINEEVTFEIPASYSLADGLWYWRVCARDGDVAGEWSSPLPFRIDTATAEIVEQADGPAPVSPDGDGIDDEWGIQIEASEEVDATIHIVDDKGAEAITITAPKIFSHSWTTIGDIGGTAAIASGPSGHLYIVDGQLFSIDTTTFVRTELAPPHHYNGKTCETAVDSQGNLYVIWIGSGVAERYDPTTDSWSDIAPFPATGVKPMDCGEDGMVYVFGSNASTRSFYRYNTATNTWEVLGYMPTINYKLYEATTVPGGLIYLCGPGGIWTYDPSANLWSKLDIGGEIQIDEGIVGRDEKALIFSETDPLYRKHFLLDLQTGEITLIASPISTYFLRAEAGMPGYLFFNYKPDAKIMGIHTGLEDTHVSFTWDGRDASATLVPDGTYHWTLEMEDVVGHSSILEGDITVDTGFELDIISAAPNPFCPLDCNSDNAVNVVYNLGRDASVGTAVYPAGSPETPVRTFAAEQQTAGEHTLVWDGKDDAGDYVQDGTYMMRIEAETAYGNRAAAEVMLDTLTTPLAISDVSISPAAFSPNGDGVLDDCVLSFDISEDVSVDLDVLAPDGSIIAQPATGEPHASGRVELAWDGRDLSGEYVADATYLLSVKAYTERGKEAYLCAAVDVDATPPEVSAALAASEPNHAGTRSLLQVMLGGEVEEAILEMDGATLPLEDTGNGVWSCELENVRGSFPVVIRARDSLGNEGVMAATLNLPGFAGEYNLTITDGLDFEAGYTGDLDSTTYAGFLLNSVEADGEIPEREWISPVYDLGAEYVLADIAWSGLGTEAPAISLSFSSDNLTWTDLPEVGSPGDISSAPKARYVRMAARFPAGAVSSLGDVALTYQVPPTVPPDLTVSAVTFEPPSPEVGEETAVHVLVSNLGSLCMGTTVRLNADGAQVEGDKYLWKLGSGGEAELTFHYVPSEEGATSFEATVDPSGSVSESDEGNNTCNANLTTVASGVGVAVSTDIDAYLPDEEVAIDCAVTNASSRARYLSLRLQVEDESGALVADLGTADLGEVAAGTVATHVATWNTGTTYAGSYRVKAVALEGTVEKASASAPFAIAAEEGISLELHSDRISYPPASTAMLRARVSNLSRNRSLEGLSLLLEVLSPAGDVVYSSEAQVDLLPGELKDVPFLFAVADRTPGTYTANIKAVSEGVELAQAQTSFEITSTAFSGAGLTGTVSVPSPSEQGQVVEAALAVTNSGNADLPALPITLLVVDPDTGDIYMTIEGTCDLAVGETESLTQAIDTALLPRLSQEKHFLAILLAELTDGQANLAFSPMLVQPAQVDHYELTCPDEAVAEEAFSLSVEAVSGYGYRPPVSGEISLSDSTGTISPATITMEDGTWTGEVVITEPAEVCTITATDGDGNTGTCTLKVLPRVDVDIAVGIAEEAIPSVLVWCDSDANEALARGVLGEAGYRYTIVRGDHEPDCGHDHKAGMEAFATEMRSGTYNLFVILSADHPLEDHLADELVELTHAGAGLIVSDAKDIHHFRTHPAGGGVIDLFGIKEMGNLKDADYEVALAESAFSPQGALSFTGKMKKLQAYDCCILGEVTVIKGNKTEVWPAVTTKEYGDGATLLFAFDLAQVAQEDAAIAEGMLTRALTLLPQAGFTPDTGALLPLSVHLQNQGIATDLRVEVPVPGGMDFLWAREGTLEEGKIACEFHLAEGEERELNMLLVPKATGSFDLTAQLFYSDDGAWILHREASITITVEKDASLLLPELYASVSALPVAANDVGHRNEALARIGAVDLTSQDPAVLDNNIFELVKAAEDLQKIDSCDITGARLTLDRLLVQAQMLWYAACGGDGS